MSSQILSNEKKKSITWTPTLTIRQKVVFVQFNPPDIEDYLATISPLLPWGI